MFNNVVLKSVCRTGQYILLYRCIGIPCQYNKFPPGSLVTASAFVLGNLNSTTKRNQPRAKIVDVKSIVVRQIIMNFR